MKRTDRPRVIKELPADAILHGEPLRHWLPIVALDGVINILGAPKDEMHLTIQRITVPGAKKRFGILPPAKTLAVCLVQKCPEGCEHLLFSVEWEEPTEANIQRMLGLYLGLSSERATELAEHITRKYLQHFFDTLARHMGRQLKWTWDETP